MLNLKEIYIFPTVKSTLPLLFLESWHSTWTSHQSAYLRRNAVTDKRARLLSMKKSGGSRNWVFKWRGKTFTLWNLSRGLPNHSLISVTKHFPTLFSELASESCFLFANLLPFSWRGRLSHKFWIGVYRPGSYTLTLFMDDTDQN